MTGSISFVPEILASARDRGVTLSPEDIESINENMGFITAVQDGKPTITAGPFLDLSEAVEAMSRGYGKPVEQPATSTEPVGLELPANATRTQQAIATNAAIRAGRDTAKQAQAETLVQTYGNPWSQKWANPTRQAIVTNHNLQLAERLKREAGVTP